MSLMDLGFQYRGLVYRGHNPQWQHAHESGEGAALNGGRWNRVGRPALYTSERFETAWLEAQQGFAFKTQPLTLCTYEVDCGPILDLSDPDVRDQVYPHPDEWIRESWLEKKLHRQVVIGWKVAERLVSLGFSGIRVPSQAAGAIERDVNVVFWAWSKQPPLMVRVIDDQDRLKTRRAP